MAKWTCALIFGLACFCFVASVPQSNKHDGVFAAQGQMKHSQAYSLKSPKHNAQKFGEEASDHPAIFSIKMKLMHFRLQVCNAKLNAANDRIEELQAKLGLTTPASQDPGLSQTTPGSQDSDMSQTTPGSQDSGINQTTPGSQDSGMSQTTPGSQDSGMSQTTPGSQDSGMSQTTPGSQDSGTTPTPVA